MIAIRLTVKRDGERLPRQYAIYENGSGEVDICEIGQPRVSGDRSICIRIMGGDVILAVEKMSL